MADECIPFKIQEEIMKRLPIKSLARFRTVSKSWKSLIDIEGSSDVSHHVAKYEAYQRICLEQARNVIARGMAMSHPRHIQRGFARELATIPSGLATSNFGGGLSDLDDIDDLEIIMQEVQSDQEQEEAAERV
ncbi:putative F-box domain-containing protein [Tanacetum coccineum]